MSAIPTIYFIDDSATMREVIKIAFRRENINVVACHDATLALAEIEKTRPDIVITDVIMPDKDGYDVCQYIKSHPELARTPVVLMSGVVNRAVAEKAFAVRADELLRKPFQPQDLIARVKHLLKPNGAPAPTPAAAVNAAAALSSIFSATATAARPVAAAPSPQRPVALIDTPFPAVNPTPPQSPASAATPSQTPVATTAPPPAMPPMGVPAPPALSTGTTSPVPMPTPAATASAKPVANGHDAAKLRIEIVRLESLVRKLQAELQGEREYARGLEAHIKALQEGL